MANIMRDVPNLMIHDETKENKGIFGRVFYPTTRKSEQETTTDRNFPIWRPRNEYFYGLADYRNMSYTTMYLFMEWVIGNRRIEIGLNENLHGSSISTNKNSSSKLENGGANVQNEGENNKNRVKMFK